MDKNNKQDGALDANDYSPGKKLPRDGLGLLKIEHETKDEPATPWVPKAKPVIPPVEKEDIQPEIPPVAAEQEPSIAPANQELASQEQAEPVAPAQTDEYIQPTEPMELPADPVQPIDQETEAVDSSEDPTVLPAAMPPAPKKGSKRTKIFAAIGIILLILAGATGWWFLGGKDTVTSGDDSSKVNGKQPLLSATVTSVDGTAELSSDGQKWQPINASTQLKEGDSIRTGIDSRAVLVLSDGSIARLGSESSIKLVSLSTKEVKIEHLTGTVYSRVVSNSERKYVITATETTYEALGTAYLTIETEKESGVQVYESSVKTNAVSETISEGKQYFKRHSDEALQGKITDINLETLAQSEFIKWNIAEDEKVETFKDKLGVLSEVKKRFTTAEQESDTIEEEETPAPSGSDTTPKPIEQKPPVDDKDDEPATPVQTFERGTMTLTVSSDRKFAEWNYTGKAIYGYKLAYSTSKVYPTIEDSQSIYFSSMNETSLRLPTDRLPKGTYIIRICAFTSDNTCVDYSNYGVISNS